VRSRHRPATRLTSRRRFLAGSFGCAALGSLLACSSNDSTASNSGNAGHADWLKQIEALESQLLPLMRELYVPGVSIALIKNATVAWTKGFLI
jgi:hypothetical protein